MWKIYCLFGFDNFFLPRKKKVLHLKKQKQSEDHSNDSPLIKRNSIVSSKNKFYSDEDLPNKMKPAPFEYSCSSFDTNSVNSSESEIQRKKSIFSANYNDRADEILKELFTKTESNFEGFELIYEDNSRPEKQKIYLKSYLNCEKHRINIYRSEWIIPCKPELFIEFMNDTPLQITLDPNIKEFYSFDSVEGNIFLMYLLYKKMYIVDSRDFVYLKYYRKINDENDIWGYTSKSISHEKFPEIHGKVRGDIILSGNIIKPINENESIVCLYSEINLKINLPVILVKSKTISEMKKYVQCFLDYIKERK